MVGVPASLSFVVRFHRIAAPISSGEAESFRPSSHAFPEHLPHVGDVVRLN
jgi:hypothetical protein